VLLGLRGGYIEDPVPVEEPVDIFELFRVYDRVYFDQALTRGGVELKWGSKMMTKCAGMCEWRVRQGGGVQIRLSPSLLQYRSNTDVKETLLHEMIHAQCFLDHSETSRDGHGEVFQAHMRRINNHRNPSDPFRPFGGYRITVYHSFIDEVRHFQVHSWKCSRCSHEIRRSMNRVPSEKDCRAYRKDLSGWKYALSSPRNRCGDRRCYVHNHMRLCGGAYVRTSEPPEPKRRKTTTTSTTTTTKTPTARKKRNNTTTRNITSRRVTPRRTARSTNTTTTEGTRAARRPRRQAPDGDSRRVQRPRSTPTPTPTPTLAPTLAPTHPTPAPTLLDRAQQEQVNAFVAQWVDAQQRKREKDDIERMVRQFEEENRREGQQQHAGRAGEGPPESTRAPAPLRSEEEAARAEMEDIQAAKQAHDSRVGEPTGQSVTLSREELSRAPVRDLRRLAQQVGIDMRTMVGVEKRELVDAILERALGSGFGASTAENLPMA